MSDLELFPVINPNIEEIIERESAIDGENVSIPEEEERLSHKDIFSGDGEKNVKMSVKEPVVKKPRGNYSHLAEKSRSKKNSKSRSKSQER